MVTLRFKISGLLKSRKGEAASLLTVGDAYHVGKALAMPESSHRFQVNSRPLYARNPQSSLITRTITDTGGGLSRKPEIIYGADSSFYVFVFAVAKSCGPCQTHGVNWRQRKIQQGSPCKAPRTIQF